MTLLDAISRADGIRPNTIPAEVKAAWVQEVEDLYSEMTGMESENSFPKDRELLMEYGYVWYVCAMIDLASKDTELYMIDRAKADEEIRAARAAYRRAHSTAGSHWRV